MIFMTVDRQGRVTIPARVRRDLGIGPDAADRVFLKKTERGTYEIVPGDLVPQDQIWLHHPEMQARLAEAEADYRKGRFTRTLTPDEGQRHLDTLKQ